MITTNTNDSVVQKPIGSIVDYDKERLKNGQSTAEVVSAFHESPMITDYSQVKPLFERTLTAIAGQYPDLNGDFSMDDIPLEILSSDPSTYQPEVQLFNNRTVLLLTGRMDPHNNHTITLPQMRRPLFLRELAHEFMHAFSAKKEWCILYSVPGKASTKEDKKNGIKSVQEEQKAITFGEYALREACLQGLPIEEVLGLEEASKSDIRYERNTLHYFARKRTRRMYQKLRTWEPQLKENEQELWPQMLDIASLDKLRSRSYKGRRKYNYDDFYTGEIGREDAMIIKKALMSKS